MLCNSSSIAHNPHTNNNPYIFIFQPCLKLTDTGLGCASASCGMALGCAVGDVSQVTELAPVIFVPQLLFAGFFIQTDKIPIFLRWAQYLCGIKYVNMWICRRGYVDILMFSEMAISLYYCYIGKP
jgi:hypothetical protein